MKYILVFSLLIFLVTSCKKEKDPAPEKKCRIMTSFLEGNTGTGSSVYSYNAFGLISTIKSSRPNGYSSFYFTYDDSKKLIQQIDSGITNSDTFISTVNFHYMGGVIIRDQTQINFTRKSVRRDSSVYFLDLETRPAKTEQYESFTSPNESWPMRKTWANVHTYDEEGNLTEVASEHYTGTTSKYLFEDYDSGKVIKNFPSPLTLTGHNPRLRRTISDGDTTIHSRMAYEYNELGYPVKRTTLSDHFGSGTETFDYLCD